MVSRRNVRDNTLLDALERAEPVKFQNNVWRIVRSDRDPTQGSSPKGRWDDGTVDVLYTSLEADGAMSEMFFHLKSGQPVVPSQMKFGLYELEVKLDKVLRLASLSELEELGVGTKNFGSLDFAAKRSEYTRTQEISEAAHFMGFDGLIVPNARFQCHNVVVFTNRVPPEDLKVVKEYVMIDLDEWKRKLNIE